jgi:hypothetical protein
VVLVVVVAETLEQVVLEIHRQPPHHKEIMVGLEVLQTYQAVAEGVHPPLEQTQEQMVVTAAMVLHHLFQEHL